MAAGSVIYQFTVVVMLVVGIVAVIGEVKVTVAAIAVADLVVVVVEV